MKEDRIIMPIRYLTIDDMEDTGEFDPEFIKFLKENGFDTTIPAVAP
jgi:hypothetical protein